ncbi:MAG: sugar phosphate isomerase/epimerase [Planctomycetes bacterium]|nr:sugar phosphate isomerase/epimerase [Planctomycetota bacterium]
MPYLTGFADEAASDLAGQIRATRTLGWSWIESRAIDQVNIHNLDEDAFARVCDQLAGSGVGINCFGSTICNWAKDLAKPFAEDRAEAVRAARRMQRLGTRLVRVMSYPVLKERDPEDQEFAERVRRLGEVVAIMRDAGITPVHENCMNYGGMGWSFTLRLIEAIPGLRLVFDTGNPVFARDFTRPVGPDGQRPMQSAWEFWRQVRDHVDYLHIKDGRWDAVAAKPVFTWPGEGDGDVRRILADALARGYDGGISIEPHLAVVFHDAAVESESQVRFDNYVEYGRRTERLIAELRPARAAAG